MTCCDGNIDIGVQQLAMPLLQLRQSFEGQNEVYPRSNDISVEYAQDFPQMKGRLGLKNLLS